MPENLNEPVSLQHLHDAEAGIVSALKRYIDERSEQRETKLLTGFHGWARPVEVRLRSASISVQGFDERLALLEERVSRIESGDRTWCGTAPFGRGSVSGDAAERFL